MDEWLETGDWSMRIGIIGAGKVGCALASKGFTISGVYSRSRESTGFLCDVIGTTFENSIQQTIRLSEVVLLTVPDSAIQLMAEAVTSYADIDDMKGKVFMHCSGALSSDVLEAISRRGGYTGSLHPIQTFAGRQEGWKGMEGICFGFEGSSQARACGDEIARAFNGTMLEIESSSKSLYHAAACILSNYTVTLSHLTGMLLDRIGIHQGEGLKAFSPLLQRTVGNILESGSINSLTGPISRGDVGVVESHIRALSIEEPEVVEVYKALGKATVRLAVEKGSIDEDGALKLHRVLGK